MVDLNVPDGLSDVEREQWLRGVATELVRESGEPEGTTEDQPGDHGQPVWAVWWTDDNA